MADDDPLSMAPPVDSNYSQGTEQVAAVNDTTAAPDSVFNWTEIPQNQQVPITRAVFDKGGYQLYDTVGETIVVPFSNQNLYVMKFGQSTTGSMYFVNDGSVPILYVPRDGYLENAAASGARWYPFSQDFHPAEPVFLGCAPSWPEYVDMGWYPGMVIYGGYYGHTSFIAGGLFLPTIGLSIFIGGHPYYGWHEYRDYYHFHPAPYHERIVNRNYYNFSGRGYSAGREFRGTGHPYAAHSTYGSGHTFGGGTAGHTYYAHRTFHGAGNLSGSTVRTYNSEPSTFGGGAHTFRGASSGSVAEHSYNRGSVAASGGYRSSGSGGYTRGGSGSAHSSSGDHSFHGGGGSDHGGGGGDHGGGGDRR